ncbi:MAG: SCO1664 family protein [Corynebacteriales bacterium]|nr:SCO1664 family protein [Mycobacteriales bacterium]
MDTRIPVGNLEVIGQVVDASNVVLVVESAGVRAVYKPVRGERPLWDFPDGTLAAREVASYLLSEAMGLGVVPVTELREGPLGSGALQRWVEGEVSGLVDLFGEGEVPAGWLPVLRGLGEDGRTIVVAHADDERLGRVALLDAVTNNADRKAGHLLGDADVWAIDNGLSFHVDPKLRTVLWGWAGRPLPDWAFTALKELATALRPDQKLTEELAGLLSTDEMQALHSRVEALMREGLWPRPDADRPVVPWPVF